MPFSKGHTPPRVGNEVALDEVEVGVVTFDDPVATADEDVESPVGGPEEIPDIEEVEFADTIDVADGELGIDGAVLGGPLGGIIGGGVKVDDGELDDTPRVFEAELEITAVTVEAVDMTVVPLEAGAVELIGTVAEPEETVNIEVVSEPETVLRTVKEVVVVLLGGD